LSLTCSVFALVVAIQCSYSLSLTCSVFALVVAIQCS
jgi:hypothetical protein